MSSHQPHTQPISIQTNIENDELRELRDQLKRYHQENDELRRFIQESDHSGTAVKRSTSDQDIQTKTTTTRTRISPDSIPDTSMPISTYTVHFEQRELQDRIRSLTEVRRK